MGISARRQTAAGRVGLLCYPKVSDRRSFARGLGSPVLAEPGRGGFLIT